MRSLRGIIGICVLAAGTASPSFAQDQEPPSAKSPGTALALSALGTVVPIALSVTAGDGGAAWGLSLGGLVLGPSLGYLYAGETGPALKGIGLRTAVLAATVGAIAAICNTDCSWADALVTVPLVAGAGVATTTVLAIVDIVRVDDRVRARNERIASSQLPLRLTYLPETRSLGLLFTLRR